MAKNIPSRTTNINKTAHYSFLLVNITIRFLCFSGLLVLVGYLYIKINQRNQALDAQLRGLNNEYEHLLVIRQNLDNELTQEGNIHLRKRATDYALRPPTSTAQVIQLDMNQKNIHFRDNSIILSDNMQLHTSNH